MKKQTLQIETIAIGDELLSGKISDTNSTFVASELFDEGFVLTHQTVIADDTEIIKETVETRSKSADAIVCFGGLGPTSDDKTAQCIADFLKCPLVEHPRSKDRLFRFMEERKRAVTPQGLKQIVYPAAAEPIFNPKGLAVGFSFVHNDCELFFLPGVPHEMKAMFSEAVAQKIIAKGKTGELVHHHVWKCLDIPESELQRLMDPIEKELPPYAYLGYRTKFPENYLTLYMRGKEKPKDFAEFTNKIGKILAPFAYAQSDLSLEEIILDELKKQKKTIVFAESCSGGIACHRLTNVPGASESVFGSYTVYQVAAKEQMLGLKVSDEGAVSRECSLELAKRAKAQSGASISASITGYMGPTGGTPTDPIGTVYLCVVSDKVYERRIYQPWKERTQAQWGAATHLLNLVRTALQSG